MTATLGPSRIGCDSMTLTVSSSAGTVGTSIKPACWYSAPPISPVAAAPVRTATIGLVRDTRRAIRANLRGLPNDSVYIPITVVLSSCSQNWSRSLAEMSLLSPSETNHDTPRLTSRALRRNDPPSEPDCIEIARPPDGNATSTSAACRLVSGRGDAIPMLDGPMIRRPLRRARVTNAAMSMSLPSTEVMITAPLMRLSMHASMVATRALAGTAMMANDTSSGSSPMLRQHGWPWIWS